MLTRWRTSIAPDVYLETTRGEDPLFVASHAKACPSDTPRSGLRRACPAHECSPTESPRVVFGLGFRAMAGERRGEVIGGRFRIDDKIGKGAMAEVYRALTR